MRTPEEKRDYQREYQRRKVMLATSNGRCPECSKPHRSKTTYCNKCLVKRRDAARARYHARRAQGLCWTCTTPAEPSYTYCNRCLLRQRNYYAAKTPKMTKWVPGKVGRPPKWAVEMVTKDLDWSLSVDELVKITGLARTTIARHKKLKS
jgi:hypothetical protein